MAELVALSEDEWDSVTLRYFAERPAFQLQTQESFVSQIAFEASQHRSKAGQDFLAAIWRLVARELLYIDLGAVDTYIWTIRISQRGTGAARDPATSPDAPDFLPLIWQRTPGASEIVKAYASEAVETYRRHSLLASVVLLGIATEAAFTDLGESFKGWLSGEARTKFADTFDRDSLTASRKWEEFRR